MYGSLKNEGMFELVGNHSTAAVGNLGSRSPTKDPNNIVTFIADKGAVGEGPSVMVRYHISGEVYTYTPDRARTVWNELVSEGFTRGQS